jgi:hypothetical protein
VVFTLLSCVENHVCLSHSVQVISTAWWAVTRIVAGVRDLVAGDRGWSSTGRVLGGRMIRRLGDAVRSAPCTTR